MSAASDPASALAACARLRGERDRARSIAVALEAQVARVEALLRSPSPPKFDGAGNFEGFVGGTEHRTVGSHRAWCYQCSEWCWPRDEAGCPCCVQQVSSADLRAALNPEPTA